MATPGPPEEPITFASVGGIDEVRDELVQIVDFLRHPERYWRLRCQLPRGVLLVGEPGTGKTLLARAVAGEAGVPFIHMAGSEFVEVYVGLGASRVRQLFAKAREAGSAIVFIDEVDAVGGRRQGTTGGTAEQNHTLNQLLTELDGFTPRSRLVVLAATNRVDVLDPALLRPGRFDQQITVHVPDRAGRLAILRIHTSQMPLGSEVDLDRIAGQTTGWTGAHLKNLVNRAALWSARLDRAEIRMDALEASYQQVLLGPARTVTLSLEDRERAAYHEAGRAVAAVLGPLRAAPAALTITPRGRRTGTSAAGSAKDTSDFTASELRARLVAAFGGRVAEEVRYDGDVSTASEDDMREATVIAANMVWRWGMSTIGPADYAALEAVRLSAGLLGPGISDAFAHLIDDAIRQLLDSAQGQARTQLEARWDAVRSLAQELVACETLTAGEVGAILRRTPEGQPQPETALEANPGLSP
ncbi:MAG: AAA family ATPase [Candidatus Dormiibacterota bacterium]